MSTPGVVRLKRLELENFRGFERLALDFEPDVTVLVGANGAGKTSIIDAIVCTLRVTHNFSNVRQGATEATVQLKYTGDFYGGGPVVTASVKINADGTHVSNAGWLTSTPQLFIYGVNRQVRDQTLGTAAEKTWSSLDATADWYDASRSYEGFFQWFKETEDLENEQIRYENAGQNPQLSAVRQAIYKLLPEFHDIRVRRRLTATATPVLTLRKKNVELAFNSLSEGERTTIAMVGDIARRLALLGAYEDPLQTPWTVIIDEFEQHAHPGWQRHLLKRFRNTFPNIQLITTTHSPVVVSEVEARQLRVLRDFQLVPAEHGPGRDANAVLEDVFGVTPRNEEVQNALDALANAIDSDELDRADELLKTLDTLIPGGADPEITYYRNILARLRSE